MPSPSVSTSWLSPLAKFSVTGSERRVKVTRSDVAAETLTSWLSPLTAKLWLSPMDGAMLWAAAAIAWTIASACAVTSAGVSATV